MNKLLSDNIMSFGSRQVQVTPCPYRLGGQFSTTDFEKFQRDLNTTTTKKSIQNQNAR